MRALLLAAALALAPAMVSAADVKPLAQAHAHNDYEHQRPLLDALDHGFTGVEADIWLVNGKLLVAHEEAHIKPERTLEALYLDPLKKRVSERGGKATPQVRDLRFSLISKPRVSRPTRLWRRCFLNIRTS